MFKNYIVITCEKGKIYYKYFKNYNEAKSYCYMAKFKDKCYRELIGFNKKILKCESEKI